MDLTNQLEDAEAAHAMIVEAGCGMGSRYRLFGHDRLFGGGRTPRLTPKTIELDLIGPIFGGVGPVEVPKNAPPMFNVIATDDFLFRGQRSNEADQI